MNPDALQNHIVLNFPISLKGHCSSQDFHFSIYIIHSTLQDATELPSPFSEPYKKITEYCADIKSIPKLASLLTQ